MAPPKGSRWRLRWQDRKIFRITVSDQLDANIAFTRCLRAPLEARPRRQISRRFAGLSQAPRPIDDGIIRRDRRGALAASARSVLSLPCRALAAARVDRPQRSTCRRSFAAPSLSAGARMPVIAPVTPSTIRTGATTIARPAEEIAHSAAVLPSRPRELGLADAASRA